MSKAKSLTRRHRSRFAGGIDVSEDVYRWLPTMSKLVKTLKSKDVALLAYIFQYLTTQDSDRRVKQFAEAAATEYAQRFAGWLGHVFMDRATRRRGPHAKTLNKVEEAIGDWVESIPEQLQSGKYRSLSEFVDKDAKFLNLSRLDAIAKKVTRVIWDDYQAIKAGGRVAAVQLNQLPIEYNRIQKRYEIPDSQMATPHMRDLQKLGFDWDRAHHVWYVDTLDSKILKALPAAGRIKDGPPPPPIAPPANIKDWFFRIWLPKNIARFDKVFNDYGKQEGVPYTFRFTVKGNGVDVVFTRHIENLDEALKEMWRRYEKAPDREGWREALQTYELLKKVQGSKAIHAIDKANNLEHSHGAMMEHFPAAVRSWYPQFLDFKFSAGMWQMIKAVRDQDMRDIAGALMPMEDQMDRIVTPKIDHRTAKGVALEISAQPGKRNKQKMLEQAKIDYPNLYPDILKNLAEKGMGLNDEIKAMIAAMGPTARVARRIAARYLGLIARRP